MGVATVSSTPSRTSPLGIDSGYSDGWSHQLWRRPFSIVAFKSSDPNLVKPLTKSRKQPKRTQFVSLESDSASPSLSAVDVDYSEVAEALENIYKLRSAEVYDMEFDFSLGRGVHTRKRGKRAWRAKKGS
ncbi:RNA polymerase sigma factor sigE, chloroplastic/mitochondrial-like [Dendrobium catenatum]|uniref:RNA polymerase sigma factor sigE, chloroplastic/mitochondrial-like n=1 Tax=Dendrobium catenatum TaxID=906689 RepID=UPI0009F5B6AC|nr:RNA polymerase sigma factor sigE, chloroplastic/mitochondrial-like [Dendrobium catenatum]